MTLFLLKCRIWNTEGINSSPGGTANCTAWLLPSSWETLWCAFGNSCKGSLTGISDAEYIGIPVIFLAEIERISVVIWASQVAQWWRIHLSMQKMQETWVRSLGGEDPLEEEMATHSSFLAWEIPRVEDPGGLQSMGLQRVGHDWAHMYA